MVKLYTHKHKKCGNIVRPSKLEEKWYCKECNEYPKNKDVYDSFDKNIDKDKTIMVRIKQLEEDVIYWKKAHLKLQEQFIQLQEKVGKVQDHCIELLEMIKKLNKK